MSRHLIENRPKRSRLAPKAVASAIVIAIGCGSSALVRADPVTTAGLIVSGAALAKELLTEINGALTIAARVDAATTSAGPDDDDLGSRDTHDKANTPLETDLDAWTTRDTGGIKLGANPDSPHTGFARMHVTAGVFDVNWVVADRYATAFPKEDSTPEPESDNKTAVASVATFSHSGKIKKAYTKSDSENETASANAVGVNSTDPSPISLPFAVNDTYANTAAVVAWEVSSFGLENIGSQVLITPPSTSIELFHNFMQLESSENFAGGSMSGLSGGSNDLVDQIQQDANASVGSVSLNATHNVDFSLVGARLDFAPATLARGIFTDRELVEQYLQSEAVDLAGPLGAQVGFEPTLSRMEFIGGSLQIPTDGILGEVVFGGGDPSFEPATVTPISQFVGLYVEASGSLLDALNRSALTSGSALAQMLSGLAPGSTFELTFNFHESDEVHAFKEAIVNEPSSLGLLGLALIGAVAAPRSRAVKLFTVAAREIEGLQDDALI